jgi:arylsulfatase A-like enzyme
MAAQARGRAGKIRPRIRSAWGCALAAALLGAPASAAQAEDAARPNVVLVTLDTLRADHSSSYGYGRPTTPQLDAVAARGALFESAYAVSATTLPAHAAIFTSLHPGEHGVRKNGMVLGPQVTTLAEHLARAGYTTAAFVSSFVVDRRFGAAQGFAHYDDDFRGADSSIGRRLEHWEGHTLDAPYDRRAGDTTDRAVAWLRGARAAQPFFLWVHYFDPHHPYDPPEPWRSALLREGSRGRGRDVDLYDGDVRYTDEQLGRMLRAVDAVSPPERTLLVILADHGEGLWSHGWLEHGVHLYEEAVRIPFVVRWPGRLPEGRRLPGLVSQVDVLPTLLSLLGLPPAGAPLRGRDLAPALRGEQGLDPDRTIFMQRRLYETRVVKGYEVAGPMWAARWRNWKLIESPREERGLELYDLAADPHERDNGAAREQGTAADLARRLVAWREGLHPAEDAALPASPAPADDEVRRRLEALGYVE